MKIVFLDIDGVLNSVDSAIAYHWLKINMDKRTNEERLDMISVQLLKRLCETVDAKIVVSSTWRLGRTKDDFVRIFNNYHWPDFPYVGRTDSDGQQRGDEIRRYVDANNIAHDEYIILDDDSDMLPEQHDRFVHVSNVNGFRSKHYCRALRLFGMPDERLESQVNFVRKTNIGE